MRRKDREMNESFAYKIVDKCEYAALSMILKDNNPYCVPLTIVRIDNFIYFHSAKSGLKVEALNENRNVCISCVGETNRLEYEFTTEYESAVVFGIASEVMEDSEKITALKALCERHTPLNMSKFNEAIEKSLKRTAVWKIAIKEITGKRKKYDKKGDEMKFGRMEE